MPGSLPGTEVPGYLPPRLRRGLIGAANGIGTGMASIHWVVPPWHRVTGAGFGAGIATPLP